MTMADSTSAIKPIERPKKTPSANPKFLEMVTEAIQAQTDRKGVSLAAIKKFISDQYPTVDPNMMKANVRKALAKGLESGIIVRPKSSEDAKGVQGRFKIDKVKLNAFNKPKKAKPAKVAESSKSKVKKTVIDAKSPHKLKTPKKTKSRALHAEKRKSGELGTTKAKAAAKTKAKPKAAKTKTKPTGKAGVAKAEGKTGAKAPTAKKKLNANKSPAKAAKTADKKAAKKPRGGKS